MPDNIHMIAYSHFSVSHQNINHAPYELSNSSCFVLPTTQKFIPKFVVTYGFHRLLHLDDRQVSPVRQAHFYQ